MKIIQTATGFSLLTFLIGCVSVALYFSFKTNKKAVERNEISTEIIVNLPAFKSEFEVIEEVNNQSEDEEEFKIKLMETGKEFHGDEIEAKSGETWLGLFSESGKHALRLTKIKVRSVHDVVVDEEVWQKTGKSVTVKESSQPLFLLRNAKMLREGEVETLFRGFALNEADGEEKPLTLLENGFVQNYEIGGESYALHVKEALNKNREKILALILESGVIKQTLYTMKSEYTNSLGNVFWVGDLDHDGKPDLFTDLYLHDNVLYRNIYLSSQAKKGDLVKKVAVFVTTGC